MTFQKFEAADVSPLHSPRKQSGLTSAVAVVKDNPMNMKSRSQPSGLIGVRKPKPLLKSLTRAATLLVALGQASWSVSAQNWERAGFGAGGFFPQVAVDPADSRIVYLASDVSGLNKSTNYGDAWFKINQGLDSREVSVFAIDPSDSRRLWAGTPLGLYSSTWISVAYDGAVVTHPAWVPTELQTTPLARQFHREEIVKFRF